MIQILEGTYIPTVGYPVWMLTAAEVQHGSRFVGEAFGCVIDGRNQASQVAQRRFTLGAHPDGVLTPEMSLELMMGEARRFAEQTLDTWQQEAYARIRAQVILNPVELRTAGAGLLFRLWAFRIADGWFRQWHDWTACPEFKRRLADVMRFPQQQR